MIEIRGYFYLVFLDMQKTQGMNKIARKIWAKDPLHAPLHCEMLIGHQKLKETEANSTDITQATSTDQKYKINQKRKIKSETKIKHLTTKIIGNLNIKAWKKIKYKIRKISYNQIKK